MSMRQEFPVIGLNGTNKQTLLDETLSAMEAVRVAIQKLESMTVNARDYGNINRAIEEHQNRQQKLKDIRQELSNIYDSIDDQ